MSLFIQNNLKTIHTISYYFLLLLFILMGFGFLYIITNLLPSSNTYTSQDLFFSFFSSLALLSFYGYAVYKVVLNHNINWYKFINYFIFISVYMTY